MNTVTKTLRTLFVVHFLVDISFAVPLLFTPGRFLSLLGWTVVDPFAARLVAAALSGIGIESLLSRNAPAESFRSMLSLKIIWSSAAILGMLVTIIQYPRFRMVSSYAFMLVFIAFNIVWVYWKLRLSRSDSVVGSAGNPVR
ncbi:MAG: hypothetical protein ABIJ86_00150 [Spirochaetota bacterium]